MKKKNNFFKRLLFISFIIFMGLYISNISGFYENKLSNKVALTDKAIIKFEKDVLDGKVVDINTYIEDDYIDYSNKFTKAGDDLSKAITKLIADGFSGLWDAIKVLFF